VVANEATDTSCFLGFFTAATGELGPKTNANLTFNSNTGVLTSASSVLTTTDINGGTVDGAVIGGSSAAAITGTTITANTGFMPDANDGAYLGQSGTAFSDLFLASGAVINFAAGDVTITHASNQLFFAGASTTYSFDGLVDIAVTSGTNLNLTYTDNDAAAGPIFNFFRESTTPAAADLLGLFNFQGRDSGGNLETYAQLQCQIIDPTATTETAQLYFTTVVGGAFGVRAIIYNGFQVGSPTGGDKGAGTINTAGDIYKNNTAYTNPDYVFEHEYTGQISKFANCEGAQGYRGRLSLSDLRDYTREHLRLPGISDQPMGMFERGDKALEKIEELTLYVLELHDEITKLKRAV
jgi:hypothetical protein